MLVINQQWLQTWLDREIPSREDVEDFLLRQGFETEAVPPIHTADIIVGYIKAVKKHPNADKLNLCSVQVAEETIVEIVCGCDSVKAGIKVAAALDGASLGDFKIEKRKIRGVLSNGMLCSMQELGFKVASRGIWHLDPDAPVGQKLDDWLKRSSISYGIELTPNRGDCLSVRGMAREFAIGMNAQSNQPWGDAAPSFLSLPVRNAIRIDQKAQALVDNFHIVKLSSVSSEQSYQTPDWIQARLLEAGYGLHHCVVDILNYAMLETGQPFHAYTGQLTDNFSVGLGQAHEVDLLNGETAAIDEQTLTVRNEEKPVCIAGYMGMDVSASSENDTSIYLEAAGFDSTQVAYHCRRYPWHTQSGSRFERGIDFNNTATAMQRAIDLLIDHAGYQPEYRLYGQGTAATDQTITLPYSLVGSILGFSCSKEKIHTALMKVGCALEGHNEQCQVKVPSWRNDLSIPESLVSEYLRIYGMSQQESSGIKATITAGVETYARIDRTITALKQYMIGQGFFETYSYSFGDAQEMQSFYHDADALVTLTNPISAALKTMRPTLLSGLLRQLKKNLAKQTVDVRLFEVGQCFQRDHNGSVVEQCMLSAIMTGKVLPESWQDGGALSFTHVKSIMQKALHIIPLQASIDMQWLPAEITGMHPHQSGQIIVNNQVVGSCGLLHPKIAKQHKIQQNVFVFSIAVDWITAHIQGQPYHSVSNQPTMRRDLSLIVPENVSYAQIKQEIQSSIFQYLTKVVIFDIYRGSQIPDGCYSISLGLLFQSKEKTLADEELVPMINDLVANLLSKLNIKTRGGNE